MNKYLNFYKSNFYFNLILQLYNNCLKNSIKLFLVRLQLNFNQTLKSKNSKNLLFLFTYFLGLLKYLEVLNYNELFNYCKVLLKHLLFN